MSKKLSSVVVYTIFGFVAIGAATAGHAQQMMIGARAGVNFANESWSNLAPDQSVSIRTGLLAGGQFDYWFNNAWAISMQLLYDQKGAHAVQMDGVGIATDPPIVYNGSGDWSATYLEIPLVAKVAFGSGALRPYLFAGPSLGFSLSNMEKLEGTSHMPFGIGFNYSNTTSNITDSTNKIDLSIVAGAGISFKLISGQVLFLDAAYAYGLLNSDNYYNDKASGLRIYSRDMRIGAGVLFPLR